MAFRNKKYNGQTGRGSVNHPVHWIFRIINILLFIFFVLVVVNQTLGVVLGPFNRVESVVYSPRMLTYTTPESYTWYIWWFIILFQLLGVIYAFIPYGYGTEYPKNFVVRSLGLAQWFAWACIIIWFVFYARIDPDSAPMMTQSDLDTPRPSYSSHQVTQAAVSLAFIAAGWLIYCAVLTTLDVLKGFQVRVTPPNYIAFYLPSEIMGGWLSVITVVTVMSLIQIVVGHKQVNKAPDQGINKKTPTLENVAIGLICAISAIACLFVNIGRNIGYGGAVIWGLVGMYFTTKDYKLYSDSQFNNNTRKLSYVQITCIVGIAVVGASIIATFAVSARKFRKYMQLYGSKGSVNKGVLHDDPYTGRQQFVASSDYV